ncbi:UNVERIFIED_CONTAM: hypothetical protein RMT77_013884 [Armadillidium vulgare]
MFILLKIFLICSLCIYSKAEISDLRACADPYCKELISFGRTTQGYNRKEKGVLSFKIDETVQIYSKEAGSNKDLWGAEISGRVGYIPKKFVKEEKVLIKSNKLTYLVPTRNKSSNAPEGPKSDKTNQKNNVPTNSNNNGNNASSVNANVDSINENLFSDEVPLSMEDAEFAALKALASKGEEETPDPSLKEESEDKEIENIAMKEGTQSPFNSKESLQNPNDNPEISQDSVDNKIELHEPITNNDESSVSANKDFQAPINKEKSEVPSYDIEKPRVSVDDKEGSPDPGNKEKFQVPTNNVEESQLPINNNKGLQDSVNREELQVPINKEGSQIPTYNVEGSQDPVDKEEFQVTTNKEAPRVPIDNVERSQVPINNKDGFQDTVDNKDEFQIIDTRPPSEGKAENEVEKLTPSEDKKKLLLKVANKDSKNEEEMGNNEGNGNEGEDNGSEYIDDWPYENNVEAPVDSSSSQPVAEVLPEPPLEKKEFVNEFEEERSPSTESSGFVPPSSATDLKLSKLTEGIAESVTRDKSLPNSQILEPTPSQIVVDGTTIVLDESVSEQPSADSEFEDTHSNLQSSSNKQVNPSIKNTTPTPRLPDGTLVTAPPLFLQNMKIVSESMPQMDSDASTPQVSEKDKVVSQESSVSEENFQNANDLTHEFSTLKPETVLEQKINDEADIQIQNQIKSTEIPDEKYSSTNEGDQVVSSKILENTSNEFSNSDDPISIENDDESRKQIVEDENLNSVEGEAVLSSKHDNIDTEKEDNDYSKGILSSISNILGYQTTESSIESNEEESYGIQQEYLKETNSESGSEEFRETFSDNTSDTSDLTMNRIPFVDPFSKPEVVHKEVSDNQNSVEENPDYISPSDKSEDVDFSSSIKKKLLHVSEAVHKWIIEGFKLSEGMALAIEGELADPHLSKGTVTFLLVVAGTIIVLYLSHMIIVKMSRESPILESLNKLDRNHRVLVEENKTLKRQLTESNGQIKSGVVKDPVAIQNLKQQFEGTKKKLMEEAEELRERNQQLEVDLEASTANEVELHRMLDELLANQKETTNFEDSVNSLQLMLENQREIVDNLTSDLALKTRLNEELRIELKDSKSKLSKLEYQIEQLTLSLEELSRLKQELTKKLASEEENSLSLREMNSTLRQEADKVSKESETRYQETQKLLKDIRKLKQVLHSKEAECRISKECVKKLQIFSDSGGNDVLNKLSEVFKIIEVKTQLESIQSERASIQAELEERENIVSSQSETLKRIELENTSLKSSSERLQKERDEATSKLEILSQYYEEKETQLKKALESQDHLLQSAEGSANLVSNRIQTYELELASCRSQIESLKNELEEQKQSYKIQLSNEEKKLHETWLSARAAERRQEELRQENTQLRQSLTQLQRDTDNKIMFNKPPPKRVDANGSISSPIPVENDINIPPHPHPPPLDMDGTMPPLPPPPMMFHPPPGLPPLPPRMFGPPLPPPPHHHHHPLPDRRLPPAGRIASPPGYDRRSYSPESDRSRYSDHRYSPSAFSPNNQRGLSPDRRSDHMRRNIRRETRRSPSLERHSPRERWFNQSPTGGHPKNHRTPPMDYYDSPSTQERRRGNPIKGKKTSTPIGPNDR